VENAAKIIRVDLDSLVENSVLQRGTEFNVKKVESFLKRFGLVVPLIIAAADGGKGKYKIIKGVEICEVAKKSNVASMDAVLISDNDPMVQNRMSLCLSTLRESENAISQGHMIKSIIEEEGIKLEELAETVGMSKSWISKRHGLVNKLSPDVMDMVAKGIVKPRTAEEVARLPKEFQMRFVNNAIFKGKELSKEKINQLVNIYNAEETSDDKKRDILRNPRRIILAEIAARKRAKDEEIGKDPYKNLEKMLDELSSGASLAMSRLAVFDDSGRLKEMRPKIVILSDLAENLSKRLRDAAEKINKRFSRFPGETAKNEAGGSEASGG
jgi:transcriptional regulator with XRE-family HTH domain